jgi:hypothetical protein
MAGERKRLTGGVTSSVREGERARAGRPGLLGRAEGAGRVREREGGERGCACGPRAGGALLGRAEGEEEKRPELVFFVFLFPKM